MWSLAIRRATAIAPSGVLPAVAVTANVTRRAKSAQALAADAGVPADRYDFARFKGMTGADIIHAILGERGVTQVFGYPGGAILPVFDAIHDSDEFEFCLPRHEQGGGHMAEGYARVTGKPGVLIVTSGPGATNAVTPLQDALSDGTPLVVLTGQVPSTMLGTDAFQEADVVGITRSCTKWNVTVPHVRDLPRYLHQAFDVAMSGRPGPVLVDLPKDVTAAVLTQDARPISVNQKRRLRQQSQPPAYDISDDSVIDRVAAMINKAKRPIIYAGQGVIQADACDVLKELSHRCHIPVTTTLQGLGAFDELDGNALCMLGMHGHAAANHAMQNADCVIALGARFDDRVTGKVDAFAKEARKAADAGTGGIIHFEIQHKNIDKIVKATVDVIGDLKGNMERLMTRELSETPRDAWFQQIAEWKEKHPFTYGAPANDEGKMRPQHVVARLNEAVAHRNEDVIITTGVGCHQMWAAQFYRWRHPATMITSGGLGTMGYGLPAAIGAQLAAPDKIVIDIDGDASFSMTCAELITAAQYKIPVKVLVLNNDFQGMVKQWQDLFYEERYSHTKMYNPEFDKVAEAMGCRGMKASTPEELDSVIDEFINYRDGPILLDARVCKKEHVYPMVPAGAALHDMVYHPSQR